MSRTTNDLDGVRSLAARWGVNNYEIGSPSSVLFAWTRVAAAAEKVARVRGLDEVLTANLSQLHLSVERISVNRLPQAEPDPALLAVAIAMENAVETPHGQFDKSVTEANLIATAQIVAGRAGQWLHGEANLGSAPIPPWEARRMKRDSLRVLGSPARRFYRADFDKTTALYKPADMRMIQHLSFELDKSVLPVNERVGTFRNMLARWEVEAHKHIDHSPSTFAILHVASVEARLAAAHQQLLSASVQAGVVHPADVEGALEATEQTAQAWNTLVVETNELAWAGDRASTVEFNQVFSEVRHVAAQTFSGLQRDEVLPMLRVLNTHVSSSYDLSSHLSDMVDTNNLEAPKLAMRRILPEHEYTDIARQGLQRTGTASKVAVMPASLTSEIVDRISSVQESNAKSVPSLVRLDALHRPGHLTLKTAQNMDARQRPAASTPGQSVDR